jgi:hypothetical protein
MAPFLHERASSDDTVNGLTACVKKPNLQT